MKKENFEFKFWKKGFNLEVHKVPWWKKGFGLMFVSRRKAKILLFDLKKEVRISIHSFFVRFPFIAIWLDENKKVIEIKKIKSSLRLVKPSKKFRYLIEIPLTEKYDAVIKNLVGIKTFK